MQNKRLSISRLLLSFVLLTLALSFLFLKYEESKIEVEELTANTWFAPYVDVTATPYFDFERLGSTPAKDVVLSFIVSSKGDPCVPTWGTAYSLQEASTELDLERRIARLMQQGGDIAISFGGLLNDELSLKCTDEKELTKAYRSVIDRYSVETIDLDLEGEGLLSKEAGERRAKVLSKIQKDFHNNNKSLAIWVTLPVTPLGLTQEGTDAVELLIENEVDLAGVNIMIMNYGESRDKDMSLLDAHKRAAIETHRQLGIIYSKANINLSSHSLWKKIGLTPMIGQNDLVNEVFTVEDAKVINEYALSTGIQRLSMWSANRDIQCGDNYVNLTVVSDSCSGIKQDRMSFIYTLSYEIEGAMKNSASKTTKEDKNANEDIIDNPTNSPYPIWKVEGVYQTGTKVVWKRNVYVAKWWTQGEVPNNPVLQAWQTPWQLIGPVLPGEKPIESIGVPEDLYPQWNGISTYDAGDRVIFNGVAFQAKWWNQGESPAASQSNPAVSPWIALSRKQIEEAISEFENK